MKIKLDDTPQEAHPIEKSQPKETNQQVSHRILDTSDTAQREVKAEVEREVRRAEDALRKDVEREEMEEREKKKRGKRDKDKSKKVLNPNPVTNEDYYQNYKKRMRNNRVKKVAVYSSIIALLMFIIVLNLYFIFIRERVSVPDIAAQVKSINKINTYPSEAVDAYLQAHGSELIGNTLELSNGSGARTYSVSNIRVDKVAVRSDSNANVYFSCYVTTEIGSSMHNFLLPLYYSASSSSFAPSGDLIMCAAQNQSTTDPIDASLWDFGKIKRYDKDETLKLTNFMSNFLEILYNNPGNDLSTFYSGSSTLGDYACSFLSIQECRYYQESNAMGLNCEIVYTLKSNEGIVFTVHNYAAVKKSGESYEIIHFY